jgi:hypothetical protein
MRNAVSTSLLRYARRRSRYLAAIAFAVLLADLLVPDVVPFADEILLALLTLLFGALSRERPTTSPATAAFEGARSRA